MSSRGVGVDGVFNNDEAVDSGTADLIRDCEGVVRTAGAVVVGLDRTISEIDAGAGVTKSFEESGPRINEALEDSAVPGANEYPVAVAGVSKLFEEFGATRNKPREESVVGANEDTRAGFNESLEGVFKR